MTPTALSESLFESATQALTSGQWERAEKQLVEALAHHPLLAEAHANLAWLLDRRGARSEALAHYEQAAALQPDNARIHLNHGALLAECRQPEAAQTAYRKALSLDPVSPGAWSNLGALLALTQHDEEAEQALRHALALAPTHTGAQFNLACLLLRKGRFDEGWQRLETRDWYAPLAARLSAPAQAQRPTDPPCLRWQGEALEGKSILVVYEAGQGDMIQFCRYVPLLRARKACHITLLCHPGLKTLLHTLDGVSEVVGYDQALPATGWDFWVPVLSLPWLCGTRSADHIPAQLPYLHATPERSAWWRSTFDAQFPRGVPGADLRVGLVWQGNPAFENDAERSLPSVALLAPLWQVPGVRFISLQKGAGGAQVHSAASTQPMADIATHLHDFADTAAAICQLDLVISVDTAVAHLAGALGVPCWVLLPSYMPDWRWLEHRSDSPWYPGVMRLFRRTPGADWPINTVVEALGQWAQS